jgi:hypothetical protein
MSCARRRLQLVSVRRSLFRGSGTTYKSGINIRKVVDLEDLGGRIGTVLGKTTIYEILVG